MTKRTHHRVQCAAITMGCPNVLMWLDFSEDITDEARGLMIAKGWSLGHGMWVCGEHAPR